MNTDNVSKLYNAVKGLGYSDLGDEEQFRTNLGDQGKRSKLYEALSAEGIEDLGTADEFNARLGFSASGESNISGQPGESAGELQGNEDSGISPLPEFNFQSKIGGAGMTPENYQFKGNTFQDAGNLANEQFAENPELLKHSRVPGFWNTYIGDTIEKIGAGLVGAEKNTIGLGAKAGNLVADEGIVGAAARTVSGPLGSLVLGLSKDKLKEGADTLKDVEHTLDERSDRYNGKDFTELYKEGDYAGMTGQIFLEASRSLPQSLMAAFSGPAGLASIGLTSANEKYDQLDENADLSEAQKIASSVLSGTFEATSELLGSVPIGNWLKSVYKSVGKDAAKSQLQKGLSGWMQKQFKDKGILLAPFAEGIEEVSSQIATNATDKALGIDPNINIMDGVFESFVYGAAGGAQFSAAAIPGLIHNAHERRKVKNNYRSARNNVSSLFPEEAESVLPELDNIIDTGSNEELRGFFANLSRDTEITEEQHKALLDYAVAKRAQSAVAKGENEEIAQKQQEATEVVNENVNPDMNAVVFVKLGGHDNPIQVVSGNIVQAEDGSIDRDNSSQEIYYIDENGETKVAPIAHIEDISEVIPTDQAVQLAQEEVAAPIIARQENDEVREYQPGEAVSVLMGGAPRFGQITEINEDGTYTFVDKDTMQAYDVEPREIINEDNLSGINQGDEVAYVDAKGEVQTGVIEDLYNFRNQGAVMIDGELIPVANVSNIAELQQLNDELSEELQENEGSSLGEQSNVSEVEQTPAVPFIDQIPKDEKGNLQFEQSPIETTIGALSEVYDDPAELSGVIDATISKLQKSIEKARTPKPTGDITKDIANKQAAKQQIQDLSNRLEYWNSLKGAVPVPSVQEVVEQPKQRTFGERIEAVSGSDITSLRDMILHGIASGSYKFNWKGTDTTPGLASETGLSGSEAERRSRIGILSNNGYTPETLAHHIWEETDGRFDIDDIRNEIIDALQSVNSRTAALNELESRTADKSDAYWAEQAAAYEYEQEIAAQFEALITDVIGQQNEQEVLSLIEQAELAGATIEQLNETVTITDIIDLIEQLQENEQQQEQTGDTAGNRNESPEGDGEGYHQETTGGTVGERNRFAEDTGVADATQGVEQNGLNHGQEVHQQVPQGEHREGDAVSQGVEAAAPDIRGRATSTGDARQVVSGKESKQEQLSALEEYAKENGVWIDNTSVLGEQFSKGGENEVLFNQDANTVFKLNNFEYAGDDAVNLFDRIDDHNNLFPHIPYALIGFSKNSKGEISAVLEQPYVSEADRLATTEEIADYMLSIGFKQLDEDGYTNGVYEVFDAAPNNVLLGADGLLYPIDTQIRRIANDQTIEDKIAQAEAETNTNPTEAQKEAGNYKKGKVTIQGFDISIEQPKGSVRSGKDASGKEWSITMQNTYGYIRKTEGKDGDHIDVFIGPNPDSGQVFVVDQVNQDGSFDEHKVMLGFNSLEDARAAYLSNYEEGWQGLGNITQVDVETFRKWTDSDTRRIKPFAEYKEVQEKLQSTNEKFAPVSKNNFEKLIDRLNQTGLAKGIIADKEAFDKKLDEVMGDNSAAKQTLSEMETVKQQAVADGTFMKAPNGKPTNLNENQWLQVRTAAFKEWFGDWINDPESSSKVVDENGEPMVVAHSTNREFVVFANKQENDSGWLGAGFYFFGDRSLDGQYGKNVMEVFLNVREPYYAANEEVGQLSEKDDLEHSRSFSERIKDEGHDGVYYNGNLNQEFAVLYPTQIKSAISNNGEFDRDNPDIRMQVIGSIGARSLDMADGAGVRMDNLRIAEAMEKENKDAKTIKLATGWEKGADGKWRYEMPDNQTTQKFKDLDTGESIFLEEALIDGELFKAYPELKNVRVEISNTRSELGSWNKGSNTIELSTYIPAHKRGELQSVDVYEVDAIDEGFRNVLLHEIQHAIQDIEGFAKGSSPSMYENPTDTEIAYGNFDSSVRLLDGDKYENIGKVLNDERFSGYRNVFISDVKEGERLLDDMRGMYSSMNERTFMDNYESFVAESKKGAPEKQYKVSAGEVEARNVQSRMNLTEAERRNSLLEETEDVPRKDQIFRFMNDNKGEVYGFVTPDGVVYLDPTKMNANTPIHEFGHLWNSLMKESNPEMWKKGVELVKQTGYWKQVNENPSYASLPEEQKADEAIAMAIGDKGEAVWKEQKNLTLYVRIKGWLYDLWQSVRQLSGISGKLDISDMTFADFTGMAVKDLLSGEIVVSDIARNKGEENQVRFQSVSGIANATGSTMTEETRNKLDKKLNKTVFKIREAWEDRHLAVKEFQDLLREKGVDIAEHNDFYKQATHVNGKNDAQLAVYNEKLQRPINEAVRDLEASGFKYRAIENYAILKHGLERNAWMRQNKINEFMAAMPEATQEQIDNYTESLPDDFSGITAVQDEVGMSADEFIDEFEKKAGHELIDNLWNSVRAATRFALTKDFEGGRMNRAMFDDLSTRYNYYIPLRGHDAETAEDRWDYSPNMGTFFVAPLIKAKGRKSRSESPFAYIASMAQSAINSANSNTLKQTILRLARKDTTGLMSVSETWYVQDGYNEEGQPTFSVQSPTYSEDPVQYQKNIEEFEERMKIIEESGQAFRSGSRLDIGGLFIKRGQADQHEVHVFQNGKEYTVYINANPAVARAINGANAKDLHKDLRFVANVSRQMSANFTTRNPIFVASNFSRDYIFASSILPVKEGVGYALKFQKNIPNAAGALQRYLRGKGDLTNRYDNYLVEYIMNGAKTGFSHIVELQKIQKQIEREIKRGDKVNVGRRLLDALSSCNEFAENLSRMSVYITSREQGRSVVQSVSDAKEVTVNFNRSGAGGYASQWVRPLYLFVNAGIQALSNFAKVAQKNKGKTAALVSSYAMTGFIVPILCNLIGGDDGLEEYMKLSDWERQNNLCIYTRNGFLKIPLPHELRVFHKMGDEVYQMMNADKDVTEGLLDVTLGFADLIPASPAGSLAISSWSNLLPDAIKPFANIAENKSFTGSPITKEHQDENKPGYLKVRTNKRGEAYAPAFLVRLLEDIDNVTGGDGVKKGMISLNPDEVNHLVRGYFGGLYSMSAQGLDIASKTYDWSKTGEFKLKVRETPLRAFYTSSDDLQVSSSGLNARYYKISDSVKEIDRQIKGYQDQVKDGRLSIVGFYEKIKDIDIEKHNALKEWVKEINKLEGSLKDLGDDDQKQVEKIVSDFKYKAIEIYNINNE